MTVYIAVYQAMSRLCPWSILWLSLHRLCAGKLSFDVLKMCNLECDELIPAFSISILASHFCKVDPSNANGAIINFGVVPKSDTIYRIYAYDASQGNTLTGTRIDDCYIENTAADPTQDRIEMDLIIDFGASTHSCGVYLVSLLLRSRVVYMVSLLLRTRVVFI